MFSQGLSGVLVASILSATSISTSIAQDDNSDFIKKRNSYPLWNGSLKRDIQGFKPGMTESEAKQRLSDCEVSGHRILCPVASKEERFELSLTEHTRPRLVKEVTYIFPAGGATLETMAKNVMMQFGVGNSRQCLPPPQGISQCSQWQLEDGSYMRLGVDAAPRSEPANSHDFLPSANPRSARSAALFVRQTLPSSIKRANRSQRLSM